MPPRAARWLSPAARGSSRSTASTNRSQACGKTGIRQAVDHRPVMRASGSLYAIIESPAVLEDKRAVDS